MRIPLVIGMLALLMVASGLDAPVLARDLSDQTLQELQELDKQINSKQSELDKLREEVRLYEKRIARQEQEEKDALAVLFDIEERISLTSRLIRALETESQQLTQAINLTQRLITKSEAEIADLKQKLAERFVHIYKQKRSSMLEMILTSKDWNQASYRAKYLKVATDYDRHLTDRMKTEIRRLEYQRTKLAKDRSRKEEALREREREEALLRQSKTERQRQVDRLKKDRHNNERLLVETKQAAVELERIIKNLEFDRERRARELAEMREQRDLAAVSEIAFYRGKLPWPTQGQVVARFGQQRNPQLNTITENPGIDIRARPGAPVVAVLDGLVTTITYLRGFGTTVIIDHGKDLYTVYTHVEDITVAEEQYVDTGQLIARVGTDGSLDGAAKLHFELWANQVKQDPLTWLVSR